MRADDQTVVPALRGYIGDWAFYAATMSFPDVARWIRRGDEIHRNAELRTWIQRKLTQKRVGQIARYLANEEQHFFNAIVVGVYDGDPEWYPVSVGESVVLGAPPTDDRTRNALGFLAFRGDEKMFAIDGQHRVEGIKQAIQDYPEAVANDELCVIFVAHRTTDQGKERTRRLFSTLNREAKRVTEGEIVALDEDNTFAVVARMIVDEYEPLAGMRVYFSGTANIPRNNDQCITTVIALYRMIKILSCPNSKEGNARRASLLKERASEEVVESMFDDHSEYWNALIRYIPAIHECTDTAALINKAGEYRHEEGGHVLFRPAGQIPFALATRVLIDRGMSIDQAVSSLSRVVMNLDQAPWSNILWNSVARRMINKNETLAKNLFLYMTGQNPEPVRYDVQSQYNAALGTREDQPIPRVE